MKLLFTLSAKKTFKKLPSNQQQLIKQAITEILANPLIGELKKGDLDTVRVYKFHMVNMLTLIAYENNQDSILILKIGSHENFYQKLKKELK